MLREVSQNVYDLYKYDGKYKVFKGFKNVIFDNKMVSVEFSKGTHELDGVNFITIHISEFFETSDLKRNRTYVNSNTEMFIYEVGKEIGNTIYKTLINSKFMSKKGNECYRLNCNLFKA